MNKLNALAVFTLVFLVSGCIGAGTGSQQGLSISLTTPTPTIDGDGTEKVEFIYKARNIGDALARNANVTVFNYGSGLSIVTDSANFGSLEPALKIQDVSREAEEQQYSFVFSTTERMLGIDDNVEVGARIVYDYDSWGSVETSIIPEKEWREGIRPQNLASEAHATSGPIQVSVRTPNPVVVSNLTDGFMIYVDLKNIGAGRVRHSRYDYDYLDSVDLNLPAGYNITDYCDFAGVVDTSAGSTVSVSHGGSADQRLKLVNGECRTLLCRIVAVDTRVPQTAQFSVVAMYRYQQDNYATVRVLGTKTD